MCVESDTMRLFSHSFRGEELFVEVAYQSAHTIHMHACTNAMVSEMTERGEGKV